MEELLAAGGGVLSPCYVLSERLLRRNLATIAAAARAGDVEIILALKAYALWKTFPIFKEYISSFAASSVGEATVGSGTFGSVAHTFSPSYRSDDISLLSSLSSHLTFNSLSQYARHAAAARAANPSISLGLRVNPGYSEIATALYDPCARGSRLGVPLSSLPSSLPEDIEGLHVHCHCESSAAALERFLKVFVPRADGWLRQVRWLNLGGGHLLTRADYDLPLLLSLLRTLHDTYPSLHLILEPGSAFAWQTGVLVAQVEDIVENDGIRTALLDVSFACHMPDCLEMPYHPTVYYAVDGSWLPATLVAEDSNDEGTYRLGGTSCLAGDYLSSWHFATPLHVGSRLLFDDMLHYTTVKTTMFNGVSHPSIALLREDGTIAMLREFSAADYQQRMD